MPRFETAAWLPNPTWRQEKSPALLLCFATALWLPTCWAKNSVVSLPTDSPTTSSRAKFASWMLCRERHRERSYGASCERHSRDRSPVRDTSTATEDLLNPLLRPAPCC